MREMKLSRIDARLEGNSILLELGEWHWQIKRYGDLEDLWENLGEDDPDERIPYWTELWPSSLALAQWLAECEDEIRDRICLDLGCGLGLTALLAQKLGARVAAADYVPQALEYCQRNARLNNIKKPFCLAMDWRQPAVRPKTIWRIWGGDIIYERRFIDPVLDFFEYALEEDGRAWLAEPGRNIFNIFLHRARERGFVLTQRFTKKVPDPHNDGARINVSVWEAARG